MENVRQKYGISGFGLKYFAAVCMLLDHMEYFFGFTGQIPIWFSWFGRLASPLFMFCIIEGFTHTSNRKKYFLKIYSLAILMGLVQCFFVITGTARPDGFFPKNAALATFSILLVILQGFDWCAHKKWARGLAAIILPLAWPFIAEYIISIFPQTAFGIVILHYSVLPMHAAIIDGGTVYILLGIVLYLLRNHRAWQAGVYAALTLLWFGGMGLMYGMTLAQLFTEGYEWMGAFAVIPMLLYNGQRGRGSKRFFYIFYPAHIYILFALSWVLYPYLK